MTEQNKIAQLQARISALYEFQDREYPQLPLVVRAAEWISFARQYSQAATVAANASPWLWLPAIQLTGQAVELALKASLAASNVEPLVEHDLLKLYCLVHETGISVSEFHQACIVHLSHFYHRDLATGTKYKSRYPTSRSEYLGGAVPGQQDLAALVEELCGQAQSRVDTATAALAQSRESVR